MELIHVYSDPTVAQSIFRAGNVLSMVVIILGAIWCVVAYFMGDEFIEYKKILFLVIALIIFVTANLNLIGWTPRIVEVYVVNDMDLLQEKLDEYEIVSNTGKIYYLKKISLDN